MIPSLHEFQIKKNLSDAFFEAVDIAKIHDIELTEFKELIQAHLLGLFMCSMELEQEGRSQEERRLALNVDLARFIEVGLHIFEQNLKEENNGPMREG